MDRLPGITSVAAFYIHITIRPPARTRKQKRCIKGLCHGWLVQFFLKKQCQLLILIRWTALKLEKLLVNEKYQLREPLYQTSQATKMNFENLLGEKVYKKHNYNPY